ncbi:unnamed protein product [Schistosoma mattheei]|uniref:Uncharacterized protein n=1 Tax=Schistosoma mattheei TaxID=31246 RepID=A0A183PDC9_9TREM|nr:unnamed protein product [Schistosoma mattheei]
MASQASRMESKLYTSHLMNSSTTPTITTKSTLPIIDQDGYTRSYFKEPIPSSSLFSSTPLFTSTHPRIVSTKDIGNNNNMNDNTIETYTKRTIHRNDDGKSVDEVVNLHRLRWLGHVLRMPEHRLPQRAMMTSVGDDWKNVRGGQTETWHQSIKSLTSSLSHLISVCTENNAEVKNRVLDVDGKTDDELITLYQLSWFKHALHIPRNRPLRQALLSDTTVD